MLRFVMRRILGLGVVAGAGALVYRFGLSKDARSKLKGAASTVISSAQKLSSMAESMQGTVMDEETLHERSNNIAEQWKKLGF